jgi:hypothetical protein
VRDHVHAQPLIAHGPVHAAIREDRVVLGPVSQIEPFDRVGPPDGRDDGPAGWHAEGFCDGGGLAGLPSAGGPAR